MNNFDWGKITITMPTPADFDSLVDDETRKLFEGTGGCHLYGDRLLVQILKELRELRAEVHKRAP